MKGIWITLGVIVFIALIGFMSYRSMYNTAISLQENVTARWADVGADYQRRADLVPQLVNTVKGAAANEQTILKQVTEARAGITNAATPDQMDAAGAKVNTLIKMTFEAYPQITSTANFAGLQVQLEGTENRIATSRKRYNEAVQQYNSHIRGFFASMFLNKATFPVKEPFKEMPGSEKAPEVKF